MNVVSYVIGRVGQLRDEEEGLALTEYLILLGLLTAAVIAAVTLFGTNLSNVWSGWATWIGSGALTSPTTTP